MDTVLSFVIPEFFVSSLGISRRRLALILGGTFAFMAVVGAVVFILVGKEEQTARQSATRFAVALVHDDPSAAPRGAGEYVNGVRGYFGPVSSATIIGARNKSINTGNTADTRSFFVVQMLLESRRGPAVIELEYDNHALLSDEVSRIYELTPGDAPSLTKAVRAKLDRAFAARGGEPAGAGALFAAAAPETPKLPVAAPSSPPRIKHRVIPSASTPQAAQLRCVQRAHGDVVKMQKCVAS